MLLLPAQIFISRMPLAGSGSRAMLRIARSSAVRPDNNKFLCVSNFAVFFLLILAGDVEVNPGPAPSLNNSLSQNSALQMPTLIATGNIHQGDAFFDEESRGRQCAFMALVSLVFNHHVMAASRWQPETVDEILHVGDSQCLLALQKGLIPDAPNFSVEQLPTTVCFTMSDEANNDLPLVALPFVATTHLAKPIVVLPLLVANPNLVANSNSCELHSEFPIVERASESPAEVNTNQLPFVATNTCPIWYSCLLSVNHQKECQHLDMLIHDTFQNMSWSVTLKADPVSLLFQG